MAYAGTRGVLKYAARTSMAVPAPAGIGVGDPILIFGLVESKTVTVATEKGEFLVPGTVIGAGKEFVVGIIHDGSATYGITWGGASVSCQAASFGATGRSATPFVVGNSGAFSTGTGLAATATAMSPGAGYDLFALAVETTAVAATQPSGMTERLDGTGSEGEVFGHHVATLDAIEAGSTGAKEFTFAKSVVWGAVLVALAPSSGTTFNDSGSGTVTATGSGSDSLEAADSGSGTVTATGSGSDSLEAADSGSGTVTASGEGSDSAVAEDSSAGTVTASGEGSESAVAEDSGSGTVTVEGKGHDSFSDGTEVPFAIDTLTESPLLAAGATTGSFNHTPGATPRAVVALVSQFVTAKDGVNAISYGGEALAMIEANQSASEPHPMTQIWFLDDIPDGEQEVVVTKTEGPEARVVICTILADGAVVVDSFSGGASFGATAKVPAFSNSAPGIALGIVADDQEAFPGDRSYPSKQIRFEAGHMYDIEEAAFSMAGSVILSWSFEAEAAFAVTGVFLLDPNPPPPPTEKTVDFESGGLDGGGLDEAVYEQAIKEPENRISIVESPVAEGKRAARFEVRGGDVEPETGANRAELLPGMYYYEGDERWFRIVARIDSYEKGPPNLWQLIWQVHGGGVGGSENSPPVALFLWHEEDEAETPILLIENGAGSPKYWKAPMPPLGQYFEIIIRAVFSVEDGEIGPVLLNGEQIDVIGGGEVYKGANTLIEGPAFDKIGIYRDRTSVVTSVLYYDTYWVRDAPITPIPLPSPPGVVVIWVLEPGGEWKLATRRIKVGGKFVEA